MKQALLLLVAIFPTSVLVADKPKAIKPVASVETHFAPDAVLTEEQIIIVRQLALKAGLPSVGKITTYSIAPSSYHGIIATGVEEVIGREVRWTSVTIHYQNEKWEPHISEDDKVAHRIGDFWISKGGGPVDEARGARFNYKGRLIRVRLLDDVQVAFADSIIAAIGAGKIQYANQEDQKTADKWRDGDFTTVGIAEAKGKNCRVYIATKDPHASLSFNCVISADGFLRVIDLCVRIS
ncbi:MAG: hypothetical protein H8M99_07665 [Gloeobacteraceae cyanobacterium ES-bin-144]|nr:hypothetical protein [Verrucomicrobiales bacterium]